MKIVIATLPSLYSLYFLNVYLRVLKGNVASVIVSTKPVSIGKRNIAGPKDLAFLYSYFGTRYTGYLMLNQLLLGWTDILAKSPGDWQIWSLQRLQKHCGFDIYSSNNFNSSECIDQVNRLNPDFLLVNGCNQIFKQVFIEGVNAQCINLHPSLLPDDRGVDPVFQKMARNVQEVSVSLHKVTVGVDEGPIFLQRKISCVKAESYFQALMMHAELGALLLQEFIQECAHGQFALVEQHDNPQFGYRSWPTKKEIASYLSSGGNLLSARDLIAYLCFDTPYFSGVNIAQVVVVTPHR